MRAILPLNPTFLSGLSSHCLWPLVFTGAPSILLKFAMLFHTSAHLHAILSTYNAFSPLKRTSLKLKCWLKETFPDSHTLPSHWVNIFCCAFNHLVLASVILPDTPLWYFLIWQFVQTSVCLHKTVSTFRVGLCFIHCIPSTLCQVWNITGAQLMLMEYCLERYLSYLWK